DRKWGTRRSAPRDYIFDRPAMLGKLRMGPDLSNIGKRAPAEDQAASPSPSASAAASPATNAPATSPTAPASPATKAPAPNPSAANSPAAAPSASAAANANASPAASAKANANASPAPANSPAAAAATTAETTPTPNGVPPQYSAEWHHLHLYSPRSVLAGSSSNMPAYKFLYEKRRISGERAADALKLTGADDPGEDWEVVPTYDAKCLVAYLMSLDQSHELKEAKLISAPAPASSPAAAASSPAPAASPAPAKEEKK
ncbi:MAG TPA: hypothetical protein VE086_01735, partial [Chthoniobacterales bacterium]|nr:hypothetical protein [Chthoniobacterales bacterium]